MKKISRLTALAGFSVITLTRAALIVALVSSAVPEAMAQVSPPEPRSITIERTFDKGALPADDIQIWQEESGGYDTADAGLYGRNTWVCTSSDDALHGKCSTTPSWSSASGTTTIPLTFIEKRSGMRVDLNVMAYKYRLEDYPDLGCYNKLTNPTPIDAAMVIGVQDGCVTETASGTNEVSLTAWLPASELKKIPVGGVWQADLHLVLTEWDPRTALADWTAHFSLKMTDADHIDIYFPAFATTSPLMELNLHPHGAPDGNAWASDYTILDMCLYDGYNVNSDSYDVSFEQTASDGRTDGLFSVYRDGGNKDAADERIDFHLKMKSPETGEMLDIENAKTLTWNQINTGTVRPVRIPSIPYAVLCAPSPLLFVVDKFDVKTKAAGHYSGVITVTFNPHLPTI